MNHELPAVAGLLCLQSFSCDCIDLSAKGYATFSDLQQVEDLAIRNLKWWKRLVCPPKLTKLSMYSCLAFVSFAEVTSEAPGSRLVHGDFRRCYNLDLEQLRPVLLSSKLRSLSFVECPELVLDDFPPHAHLERLVAKPCLTRNLTWLLGLSRLLHLQLDQCEYIDGNSLARLRTLQSLEVTLRARLHQTMSQWGLSRDLPELSQFLATEQFSCAQAERLGKKESLRVLTFRQVPLGDYTALALCAAFPCLQELRLELCDVGRPRALAQLAQLRLRVLVLKCSGLQDQTLALPSTLQDLTSQHVDLQSPTGRRPRVGRHGLTNRGLERLSALTQLQALHLLSLRYITAEGLAILHRSLRHLRIVDCRGIQPQEVATLTWQLQLDSLVISSDAPLSRADFAPGLELTRVAQP